MSSMVGLLVVMFSFMNILYMHVMQNDMYVDFINEPNLYVLFLAYIGWILMAFSTKKLIVENKPFNLVSVFTTAPLLGFVIYLCINISIMTIEPNWSISMLFTDVIFGMSMFSFASLIVLMLKPYIK